jgi:hypothetical protein
MKKKFSRRRAQISRRVRICPQMTTQHSAFLYYLKELGYTDNDIEYQPIDMARNLVIGAGVVRKYTPTFFVAPELTVYDIGSKLNKNALEELTASYRNAGYEFQSVSEEDFPFDEYVDAKEATSNES